MSYLLIKIEGKYYKINKKGEIYHENGKPSGEWLFLGVSTHHWHNRIIHTFSDIWENPTLAEKGYLWDKDHGTIRTWGGQYCGKIPRIESCYKGG